MIVLDTDHMSLLEHVRGDGPVRLRRRMELIPLAERTTTIISFEEQTRGWLAYAATAKSIAKEIEAYERLRRHLVNYTSIVVLPFDDRAAVEYQQLRGMKIRIGTMDLKIAAIALSREATLLSRNLSDFRKVPNLKVEDWTA